jgi:hypothetical protein
MFHIALHGGDLLHRPASPSSFAKLVHVSAIVTDDRAG